MSMYGEDDFVACLAFVGTQPSDSFKQRQTVAERDARLRYHDAVETFCINWFKGKPIDGQWAAFLSAFLKWQVEKAKEKNSV